MPSKPCVACGKSTPIFSDGKCHICYALWGEANGVPETLMPKRCGVEGCNAFSVKKSLCDRHYRRFLDHGSTEKVRQQGPSEQRRHREYKNWLWLRGQGKLCAEWHNFWTFIESVGERPTERHWLEHPNAEALYGPGNWEWRAPRFDEVYNATKEDGDRAYKKAANAERSAVPGWWVASNLRRYYGMTEGQYADLLTAQGGGCALCGRTTDVTPKGQPQLLAVDHDHKTGEIRGLLCREHNAMLGYAGDAPETLRKAADYLERPRHTGMRVPRPGDEVAPRRRGVINAPPGNICMAEGCEHRVKARGLCQTHYVRFVRTGSYELAAKRQIQCAAPGCESVARVLGMCHKHYVRMKKTGSTELPSVATCTFDGCDKPVAARDLCNTHYMRWRRHGSPDAVLDTHGRPLTCDAPASN